MLLQIFQPSHVASNFLYHTLPLYQISAFSYPSLVRTAHQFNQCDWTLEGQIRLASNLSCSSEEAGDECNNNNNKNAAFFAGDDLVTGKNVMVVCAA